MESPFEFSGGALCLDFVNTLGDRPVGASEKLVVPADLVRWGREAGLVDVAGARRLDRQLEHSRATGERFFGRAIDLRERLFRLFAPGVDAEPDDLALFNRDLAAALARLRVHAGADGFAWVWDEEAGDHPDRLLWPVLRSAADVLTSDEAVQVKECASQTCSWLFVDRSRTHRRRWCDMKSCGNRAKARRHYQRKKKEAGSQRGSD